MAKTEKETQQESTPKLSTKTAAAANGGSVTPGSHPVPVPPAPPETGEVESVAPGSHPVPGTDEESSQAATSN